MDKEPVDSAYDTVVDNRPKEIEKDGKTYVLVPAGTYPVGEVDDQGHLTSSDDTTGKVIEGDKNVTYVYKLKEKPKGEVIITYVDEKGKEIQKPRQDTPNSPYDTPYNTTEEGEKPNFIKAEDGKTYKIVPKGEYQVGKVDENGHLEKSDPVTGKVTKPKSTITYVYKEVNGSVFVHYKDTEGNELKDSVTDMDKEPVDSAYDTVVDNRPKEIEKDGKTYVLVPAGNYPVGEVDDQGHLTSSDDTTGKVAEQDKNVTYIYKLKEEPVVPKGNVYVHYVDTEGKTIKSDVTDEDAQPVDKDYDTVVDNRPQEIEFEGKTYELVPAGNYTVGEVDDEGHLKSTDPTTGKVIEDDKNVTYVYKLKEEPKGEVVITYVDENGKEIQKPRQDTPNSPYDTPYNTTEEGEKPNTIKTEDGKTYKIVPKGDYPVGKVDENGHLESSDPVTGKVTKPKSTITYVYKEVNGNVYVHYKDTEGNELKASVTDMDKEPVDSDYDTVVDNRPQEIEKDGKTYVLVPAGNYTVGEVDDEGHLKSTDPTTGKVIEGDKNVTYVYKLKEEPVAPKGNVYVHYVDTEGKTIKSDVTDEDAQPVDKDYDTVVDNRPQEIEFEGKTYELVPAGNYTVGEVDDEGHLKSTDPTTGKVIEGDKNVTYVYKLKEEPAAPKGNVYVHYVDTEGKTIKSDVTDEDAQPVDKDYDTVVDNRPQEIEKDGKTYVLVPAGNYTVGEVDDEGHLKSTDPTTGKVIEGDKNVTYVYKLKETPAEPKKGEVIITYVDENGKEIEKPRQDTPNSPYDTPYNTTEEGEKPNTIKTPDGKTYKIVPKGDYPVGKVDEDGHLESSDPVKGKVDKPKSTITYVYKEVKGNVYVHYVDTEGKTIKSDVTDEDKQPVDKDYDTVVDNRPQEIEFEGKTYELVPAGNYTVGEVDEQGHLKSSDPTTGKVIEGDKNVTYVYKLKETPKGNVYVHYVDTEGKTIKSDVTDEDAQPVDKDYDTVVDNRPQEIEFEGKTYELVPAGNYTVGEVDEQGHLKSTDPTTGKVIEGDKNVTYVYKLKETPAEPKGNVYVHYVDTEGKTIKSDVTDEDAQPVDKDYDTVVDNRPQEIEFEGKTYELVPAGNYTVGEVDEQGHLKSTDPTTGKVIEGDKNVTYVYKLKETPAEPKGNVYVHYVDTEGKTIKSDVTDEDAQPVDKDYDTVVDNRPQEIEFEGKTYELVPAGNYTVGEVDEQGHLKSTDPTTGKVIEGDKNVTYVYKLKETPAEPKKGEVIITYVDENGKEIEKPRQDTPNSPYDTPYNTTEEGEKPNTIKTPDGKTYKIVPKGDYPVGKVDEDGHLESSDPVKGKVDKPKSTITYVYKEVKGNVYVHYVDTEGKTIKSDVTDEDAQPVDKDYDTVVDNRPQEIEFEGKTYELVPAGNYTVGEVDEQGHLKSTDPTTGAVAKEDKNVTYVYKLKETPAEPKKGEVIITYVDENGKEIEKPRQDTPNSPYDTPYNTTEEGEKPNTIKTPDGKTYKIVPKGDYPVGKVDEDGHLESSDPVKGKVDKPKLTITYVYKEVKGNVYVHYVDTEGKTIKSDVTDEDAQPVDKDYDTVVDNRPQEIEFEGKTYELVSAGNYTVGEVDEQSHLKSTDPTTGKVIEGDKNVTYVYKLKETPDKPVEPTPDKPVEPTPDKPVEPTPDKPVEPTPDKPVEPTPDKPVEPTPDKPVEPTPDKPVEPTPDKPVEPTPDKPVEPTPDKPVEPTPDKPVEPTPDKPVEPTPDKPVEPTPDKPVEPTPDKPVEPTPDKPVEPTPDKPVEPTPDKPVEPTPDKPVEPTPDKPVEPTPDKPVEPTPDKPVEPTPDKPVEPTPDKPVKPTPGKPVEPTPDKPVKPTPDKPVEPTPGKPVDPTSAKGQLPNTGETTSAGSTVLGVVAGLVGLAALGRRKKEDEK
ncbi:MucBP domain-containing protein [Streptococcus infantis]|uniref:LPXTG cell wall anchor domain-containing protein n=1 Tax=Streptococcus infantis TaxID=68892 RepID=UPI0039C4C36C